MFLLIKISATSFDVKRLPIVTIFRKYPKVFFKCAVIHDTGIGHVMRKLNGITINGEYLGNSVVINGMFRAICTISPVIMRDFVQIINKIEKLDDAVKIKNFNCGYDSIDIEFYNSLSKGIASLYFKLVNGQPELTNYKLVFNNKEYNVYDDKNSPDTTKATNPNQPVKAGEETERQRRLRELKEKKLEQQKKILEQKRQKIEELKKQRANAIQNKNLSPEEQKKERLEQLKKKREELLQRKQDAIQNKLSDVAQNNAASTAYNANKGIPAGGITNASAGTTENPASVSSSQTQNNITSAPQGVTSGSNAASDEFANKNQSGLTQDSTGQLNSFDSGSEITDADDKFSDTASVKDADEFAELENEFNELNTDNIDEMTDDYQGNDSFGDSTNDFDDIDYDNLTDEELAELEAEINAELGSDPMYEYSAEEAALDAELNQLMGNTGSPADMQSMYSNFAKELNDGLSQGLIQGLSQGLSEGLSQGLSQGLSSLFGNNFNPNGGFSNDGLSNNQPMNNNGQYSNQSQNSQPDFSTIDEFNNNAAMSARESYSYDENSNMDELSDIYSDFYSENEAPIQESYSIQQSDVNEINPDMAAIQAELNALRSSVAPRKDLMTKEEFLDRQKELEEARERKRRQKFKMVGSKGKVSANALEDGIFVAGKKFYKWGEVRTLDS